MGRIMNQGFIYAPYVPRFKEVNFNSKGAKVRDMEMKVAINKIKLLMTLKKNKENHKILHKEARAGYIDKAKEQLATTMQKLDSGEAMHLSFNIYPPHDHTKDYDQAITMIEWSEEDVIQLTSREFKTLVLDEWDWLEGWARQNVDYSASMRAYAVAKGFI